MSRPVVTASEPASAAASPGLRALVRLSIALAAARPALALYLAALALLPWTQLGPLDRLHEHAQASDVLFAGALVAAVWEAGRMRIRPRVRAPHVALGAYLAFTGLSALFASGDRGSHALVVLATGQLAAIAMLTSHPGGLTR